MLQDFEVSAEENRATQQSCSENTDENSDCADVALGDEPAVSPFAEMVKFKAGEIIDGTLTFHSSKKVSLEFDDRATIKFRLEKDVSIPQENGDFHLLSKQIGQPYDISGRVATSSVNSDVSSGSESCSYTIKVRICETVIVTGPDGKPRKERRCRDIERTIQGYRWAEWYYRHTTKIITLRLLKQGTTDGLAEFGGKRETSDRIYTKEGPCNGGGTIGTREDVMTREHGDSQA